MFLVLRVNNQILICGCRTCPLGRAIYLIRKYHAGMRRKGDGYQIVEDEKYYETGVSTYKFAEINPTQIEKGFKTTDDFVHF